MPNPLSRINRQKVDPNDAHNRGINRKEDLDRALLDPAPAEPSPRAEKITGDTDR
jgi:hypothetical protein